MTAIQPPGRYGALQIENGAVHNFQEKPAGDGAWINGGFFVLEPGVLENIDGDNTVWEQQPLQQLALQGQLSAYQHDGFWQAMDTLREKTHLEELWASGIKHDLIDFICDAAPSKQNKYMPGSHIPILPPAELAKRKPDWVIILPWNIAEEVTQQQQQVRAWGGKFVIAVPDLKVLA